MNRDKAVRMSFFDALNGELTYNSVAVPISDMKLETDAPVYVLITRQTATLSPQNYDTFIWETTLTLEIHSVHQDSVTKDIVDEVGEQIEQIIIGTSPQDNGLVQQEGWVIDNVYLSNSSYGGDYLKHGDSNYVIKLLTFTQTIELS